VHGNVLKLLAGAAAALLAVSSAFAQQPTAQSARVESAQRMRADVNLRDNARESMAREAVADAPPSPGDPDLGEQVILKRREKVRPFTLSADVSGFYTTNAALTDDFKVDDYFMAAQVALSYQPQLAKSLYGEITVRQAFFRYNEFDELDFNSLNAGGGLTYVIQPLWNTALSLRYNYNRLTDGSGHDEFFRNHTITLSLLKTFELSKAHYIYVGASGLLSWAEPKPSERDEYGIYAGYRANLTRALTADAYYRLAFFDYTQGRNDWNQTLAFALRCNVTRALSVSASASFGFNNSNQNVFDYQVFNAGLSVTASMSF
jgi:hypothetical protein